MVKFVNNSTGKLREMQTKGGRGSKNPKILRTSFMYGPLVYDISGGAEFCA